MTNNQQKRRPGRPPGYKPPPRPRDPDRLSPMMERFAEEYVVDLDAQRAAIEAGYSPRNARAKGHTLLLDPRVKRKVDELKAARSARTATDADWVLTEARKLYERCVQEVRPAVDRKGRPLKDEDGNSLFVFNGAVAARALELVGRHVKVGAFEDRVVHDTAEAQARRLRDMGQAALGVLIEVEAEPVPALPPPSDPKPRHRTPSAIAGTLVTIKPTPKRQEKRP